MGEPSAMKAPTVLYVSYLALAENPTITDPDPALGWIVAAGAMQSACQVQLRAPGGTLLALDTGKLAETRSQNVRVLGKALKPNGRWEWRVRLWDGKGKASPWSAWRRFETATLGVWPTPDPRNGDWQNRHPLVTTEIRPETVTRRADGVCFADFGRAWFGVVSLKSSKAGRVSVSFGEKRATPTSLDRKPPGSVTFRTTEADLAPNLDVPLATPAGPFSESVRRGHVFVPLGTAEVAPLRAVEISGWPDGRFDKKSVALHALHSPFDEKSASFESSDPMLDKIWELSRHTLKATSFLGVSIDGERERTPYEADAYLAQLGHLCCERDAPLYRWTLEYLLHHSTWPTEWALHLPLMAEADYLATGDASVADRLWNRLEAKLLRSKARPDGLLVAGAIVDWPPAERDGFGDGQSGTDNRQHAGPMVNVVANAFAVRSLAAMERLARATGRSEKSESFARESARVREAFQKTFFDPARGLFVDGEGTRHVSLHGNLFPLAFGLAPTESHAGIVKFLKTKGMACSVYAAQYLMEALFTAGEAEYALSLMTAPGDRSWRHMVESDAGMTWEAWDARYKPNLTWNHAWGAAPANLLPRFVLGVTPIEPGFSRVRIAPQPGKLKSVKGTVCTYRGPISVSWERNILTVEIPGNATASVTAPGGRTYDGLGPGKHTLKP